jgi:hypothetical protein
MSQTQPTHGATKAGSAPSEERAIALELAESLGITRQVTETYSVGGYHYTNIGDAIAQARRMTTLERKLL